MPRIKTLLATAFAAGLASPLLAQFPLDSFTVGGEELYGSSGSLLTVDANIVGGSRLTTFDLVAGSSFNPAVGIATSWDYNGYLGYLCYSSTFGNFATWSLDYGSQGDMNADLTACGADRLILGACCQLDVDASGDDLGMWGVDGTPMTLTIWSDGVSASVTRDLYSNPGYLNGEDMIDFEFLFTDFPGIDFSDVDRILFEFHQTVQNPAVDYCFHGIYLNCEPVPVDASELPAAFALGAAWPNPFNPSTTIEFSLAETGSATLAVYDLAGRQVATLVSGLVERGTHSVVFDAGALPSGVYFYSLEADGLLQTRKMLLVK
jgi:hypothetical protein